MKQPQRMESNKYTKTKTPFGEDKSMAWWRIKQFRIDTTNHPIIKCREKCASRISTILSQQEEMMIEGLKNSLQCSPREAIRIALYEVSLASAEALTDSLQRAKATSTARGHTSRSRKHSANLPRNEKEEAMKLAMAHGISEKEIFRLAVIYLEHGIRTETIVPQCCRRISQKELSKKWERENNASGPSRLEQLKVAGQLAWNQEAEEGQELDAERYELDGEWISFLSDSALGYQLFDEDGDVCWDFVRAMQVVYGDPLELIEETRAKKEATDPTQSSSDSPDADFEDLSGIYKRTFRQEGETEEEYFHRIFGGKDRYEAYMLQTGYNVGESDDGD